MLKEYPSLLEFINDEGRIITDFSKLNSLKVSDIQDKTNLYLSGFKFKYFNNKIVFGLKDYGDNLQPLIE